MKISEITYLVVKNVKYLDDTGFTYDAFKGTAYDPDQDYITSLNNAMTPINEAIHRLSDRNKIAFRVDCLGIRKNSLVSLSSISKKIKKIKAVFYMKDQDFMPVGFREFNKDFIFIERLMFLPLYIQYVEDIPPFKMSDFKEPLNGYIEEGDTELSDLGISDTMCDYIIEYAQGKLQEPIAPELANLHITRAEQYFDDLEEQQTMFGQKVVTKKFRI